jgi:hypothetical protein|tara:strand:+ start:4996 stop:5250 length:255 start_codon:yes stop_codon:yes gene_type:complete
MFKGNKMTEQPDQTQYRLHNLEEKYDELINRNNDLIKKYDYAIEKVDIMLELIKTMEDEIQTFQNLILDKPEEKEGNGTQQEVQ